MKKVKCKQCGTEFKQAEYLDKKAEFCGKPCERKYGKPDERLFAKGLLGPLKPPANSALSRDFLFPPFSVWNTREGQWQNRKRRWIKLGIESELGRNRKLLFGDHLNITERSSIFDPVVCELVYRWFCPPGGIIIDPFAGGSVRGIVASCLGYKYWGCDLRAEQIEANKEQLNERTRGQYRPKWIAGDSLERVSEGPRADFVFSCPPYGDLEKYSDDPKDISNMKFENFLETYRAIISKSLERLKNNRFACFVVSNYRCKKTGAMRDFTGATISAFEANAGVRFYNDVCLINSVGSGCLRARRIFVNGNQKVVKMHQNVLVFVKGKSAKAAEWVPKGE